MAGKKRGNFSPEFKEEAARMVVETSRSIAEVTRELGLNGTTLGYWVKAYRESHAGDEPVLRVSERARLRELERRNRDGERVPEKSSGILRKGAPVSERYAFIEAEDATAAAAEAACAPTITQMCAWLRVSRSGFYDWKSWTVITRGSTR